MLAKVETERIDAPCARVPGAGFTGHHRRRRAV